MKRIRKTLQPVSMNSFDIYAAVAVSDLERCVFSSHFASLRLFRLPTSMSLCTELLMPIEPQQRPDPPPCVTLTWPSRDLPADHR